MVVDYTDKEWLFTAMKTSSTDVIGCIVKFENLQEHFCKSNSFPNSTLYILIVSHVSHFPKKDLLINESTELTSFIVSAYLCQQRD